MFLGASLDPEYFNSRVNLFVALGPVTSVYNSQQKEDSSWREFEWAAYELGAFNLFGANWMEEEAIQIFCNRF